jgi:phosphoserine phosphatase
MLIALTLVSAEPGVLDRASGQALQAVASVGGRVKEPRRLGAGALDLLIEADAVLALSPVVGEALASLPVDYAVQAWSGRRKRLLLADMDSTIIGCECLDELADYAGVKTEVAAITERAMNGDIAFEGALKARVGLLKGLPLEVLERCYEDRVELNPGARALVRTMAAAGARCVLVSGGFTAFTGPVAEAAGFHAHRANVLLHDGDRLTGAVKDPILGREAKLAALLGEAEAMGVGPEAVLAVGDGANDLMMIKAAGLGVAYRAKPLVATQADARVEHGDLTALLYFQGYAEAEVVRD